MRIFVISLLATFLLTACEEHQPSENMPAAMGDSHTEHAENHLSESLSETMDDTHTEHAEKHLDTKYTCPMHPEVVKDEPGSCPICGMFLVEKKLEPKQPLEMIDQEKVN